jgi:hypothetical protein
MDPQQLRDLLETQRQSIIDMYEKEIERLKDEYKKDNKELNDKYHKIFIQYLEMKLDRDLQSMKLDYMKTDRDILSRRYNELVEESSSMTS